MSETGKDRVEKAETPEVKPPAEVQRNAVIGGNAHQASWKDMDKAHWLDQDESATGLFFKQGEAGKSTCKFGIDGLEQEAPRVNADGTPYKVITQPALMSPTKIDPISPELTQGVYQSSVKLNVQVSQIPEVSAPLTAQDALEYASTVMATGAAAVRQTEHHMTEPNAINSDIASTLEHFSRNSNQVEQDVQSGLAGFVDQLDKPMKSQLRAKMVGEFMPLFFFGGAEEPIDSGVANQMKLAHIKPEELEMLGIERRDIRMPEIPPEVRDLELQRASPELLSGMERKGRVFVFAAPDSEEMIYLNQMGARALVRGAERTEIWVMQDPEKIAVWEEFLHGTQSKHGWFDHMPVEIAEVRVKDFMLRHPKMLGLVDNDCRVLKQLKYIEFQKAVRRGFTQYEIEEKKWLSLPSK